MVRSVVDSVMQYFVAATTRDGSSSRSFGGDVAVHFIEGNPSLRHYAQLGTITWSPSITSLTDARRLNAKEDQCRGCRSL